MKDARRFKTAAIGAVTVAIGLLIGTNVCDAMSRGGVKRVSAIRSQSFAAKSSHMAINRIRANRALAVRAQSFGAKNAHKLSGLAFPAASAPRKKSFSALTQNSRTLQSALPLTVLPLASIGSAGKDPRIRPPFDRIPDPSDIGGMQDQHFPGRDMINSKYLGGPDREFNLIRDDNFMDYWSSNTLSDISDSSCLWDQATWDKVSHWGGTNGNPLIRDSSTGNWICDPPFSQGNGNNKGSGGKETSTSGGGAKKDNETKDTKEGAKEAKVVKEDTGKKGDKGGTGTEGDDPDELRSPIAQELADRIDMAASLNDAIGRIDSRSGNSGISSLSPTGTNTPPPGLFGRANRLGPDHKNRPDAMRSQASSLVTANSMSDAASPTPDGGSNPPPGPEFNPVASMTSAASGINMTNQAGYAATPAIGDDGGQVGPLPGPK